MDTYPHGRSALLLVDPYNDFLSAGGKFWPMVEGVANDVGLIANLQAAVAAVREAGLPVVFVPHRRSEPGDYRTWDHPNPYQLATSDMQPFAKGTWGGEWRPEFAPQPGDLIAKEHWGSSGFANTDLDLLLKQHRITHVILVGLLANTCIECTGRFASELGYHVTLITDATAAFSPDRMFAAHALNAPTFAHAILTTRELVAAMAARETAA
ncbi:MAG: isochorismatase family cysteine hydrolase [Vicinamibacterales bacterium]